MCDAQKPALPTCGAVHGSVPRIALPCHFIPSLTLPLCSEQLLRLLHRKVRPGTDRLQPALSRGIRLKNPGVVELCLHRGVFLQQSCISFLCYWRLFFSGFFPFLRARREVGWTELN